MNFRTNIQLQEARNQIDYHSKLLLIGSCFSENIQQKLTYFKFQSTSNPFGILFNPKAIETLITNTINLKTYTEENVFLLNERWHCFDVHSDLSTSKKEDLISKLNTVIAKTHQQLLTSTHVIITLGTAWTYRFIETNSIVGNCHKVPQKKFLKELLSVKEVVESLEAIQTLIKSINPASNIIFTVSPVRHIKDGFVENTQSKAHLITAIHNLIEKSDTSKIHYFPSYEIMMDDLRDYRFYANDMLHPNETAVHYIWEQFQHVWISKKTQPILKEVDTIQKGLAHRPFNPSAANHLKFLENLNKKIQTIQNQHPFMRF